MAPLVVGMYEFQVGRLEPDLLDAFGAYWSSEKTGTVRQGRRPQMRVIPIGKSVAPEIRIAQFDEIGRHIESAGESIAITECICRKTRAMGGHSCERTDRLESCMALSDWAEQYIEQGHFAPGSMGPKVEAILEFLKKGGRRGLITSPEMLEEALAGRAGTHFVGRV